MKDVENICNGIVYLSVIVLKLIVQIYYKRERERERDRNNGGLQRLTVVLVEISFSSLKFPL